MAQEQQRRPSRPLEVLDHQQQRARRRGLPEQRGDGLEQPVAAVLALGGERRAGRSAELRHQRREVGRRRGPARVGRVVAQRLHERLVGHDRLLVDAPVQDGRAARVGGGGEARRQPRLAHAGLPGEHDDAALRAPALVQHGQLGLAADEGPLLQPLEHDRERDGRARRGRRGGGRGLPGREQALVERGDLRRRRRPQLVAQQHAQLVVDAQRLGDVAARGERLHQRAVGGLAVGLARDQGARRALGRRQLARPEPQRRARERLQGVGVQRLELPAALLDPAPGQLGQQRALEPLQRRPRPPRPQPRGRPRRAPPPPRPPPRAPPPRRARRRAARAAGRRGPRSPRARARAARA